MKKTEISRATLGRVPAYIRYLKSIPASTRNISATTISRDMGLGEVQVRKDLCALCGAGKPKIGYSAAELTECLEKLIRPESGGAIIVGAGKLGRALLDYGGFDSFGLSILAAFDIDVAEEETSQSGKPILPVSRLPAFCKEHDVKIGIITVPAESAQEVCNTLYENGIKAMWCFAPCLLYKPADAVIQYENLALSLAHLKNQIS